MKRILGMFIAWIKALLGAKHKAQPTHAATVSARVRPTATKVIPALSADRDAYLDRMADDFYQAEARSKRERRRARNLRVMADTKQ